MELVLKFTYNAEDLGPEDVEATPRILWWSSASPGWHTWTLINWKDDKKTKSIQHEVKIPLGDGSIRTDDTVRMESVVLSPNQDNRMVRSKAGSGYFYVHSLIKDQFKEKKGLCFDVELRLNTFQPDGEPYLKGSLNITISNAQQIVNSNWKVRSTAFGFEQGNTDRVIETVAYGSLGRMIPFDPHFEGEGLFFPPTDMNLVQVHAPLWMNEVGPTPGWCFWINPLGYNPHQEFFSNLARVAMARRGMEPDAFIRAVDQQLSSNGRDISHAFYDALLLTADMFTIPSTSLPYIGDYTYTSKRGVFRLLRGSRVSIESFHDALRMLGGDCEDLACLINRIAMGLEVGMPHLKDESRSHTEFGGWTDPVLQRMQILCHMYVPMGTLGSVVGAYLGQKDKKMIKPPIIDSNEDKNVELGAHMWWEWIPLQRVEELMNETNSRHFRLYPNEPHRPWESNLPHFVGEGTGYLGPDLLPVTEYFSGDPTEMRKRREERLRKVAATYYIGKNSKGLSKGRMQRLQEMVDGEHDRRLSTFYRESIHCYSAKFLLNGFNFSEFTWTYTRPRFQEGGPFSAKAPDTRWRWAVPLRDKLYRKQKIGLVVTPGYFPDELHAVQSMMRQMPPLSTPELSGSPRSLVSDCERFQGEINRVLESFPRQKEFSEFVNVYFTASDFTEANRAVILADVKTLGGIRSITVTPESITDEIHNVRLTIYLAAFEDKKPTIKGELKEMSKISTVSIKWRMNSETIGDVHTFQSREEAEAFSAGIKQLPLQISARESELRAHASGSTVRKYYDGYTPNSVQVSSRYDNIEAKRKRTGQEEVDEDEEWNTIFEDEEDKIERLREEHIGESWCLLAFEGSRSQEYDEIDYVHRGFSDRFLLRAYLRGVDDGTRSDDMNLTGLDAGEVDAYTDGHSLARDRLEQDLFPRVVYRRALSQT